MLERITQATAYSLATHTIRPPIVANVRPSYFCFHTNDGPVPLALLYFFDDVATFRLEFLNDAYLPYLSDILQSIEIECRRWKARQLVIFLTDKDTQLVNHMKASQTWAFDAHIDYNHSEKPAEQRVEKILKMVNKFKKSLDHQRFKLHAVDHKYIEDLHLFLVSHLNESTVLQKPYSSQDSLIIIDSEKQDRIAACLLVSITDDTLNIFSWVVSPHYRFSNLIMFLLEHIARLLEKYQCNKMAYSISAQNADMRRLLKKLSNPERGEQNYIARRFLDE